MKQLGIIGAGHYVTAFLTGLLGRRERAAKDVRVLLSDKARRRVLRFATRLGHARVRILPASEVWVGSDVLLLGVPVEQVLPMLRRLISATHLEGEAPNVFLLDTVPVSSVLQEFPNLKLGAMTFNFLVRERQGFTAIWRGTTEDNASRFLGRLASRLGLSQFCEDIHEIATYRATAGCGLWLAAHLAACLQRAMHAAGLEEDTAREVVAGQLQGVANWLRAGKSPDGLLRSVPARTNSVMTGLSGAIDLRSLESSYLRFFETAKCRARVTQARPSPRCRTP